MKHQAIYNLYPNVKTIDETEEGLFPKDENNNLVSIDISAVEVEATKLQSEKDAKVEADKNLKASAKAKLIAGEALTQEEADTIVL